MSGEWTDPEERCPACGAHLLIERFENTRLHAPVRYCSFVHCDWSDHPELSPTCCPGGCIASGTIHECRTNDPERAVQA